MTRIPLALLPGTLCNALMWQPQVVALGDIADPHVIDTSLHDTLAGVVEYIYTQMPRPFALAGLSYGGIVAFEMWRRYPQAVSHLALLDTTPYAASPQKREIQQQLVGMALLGEFREVTTEHLKDAMLHPENAADMDLRARILQMAEQVGMTGFVNQIKAQLERPDSTPDLPTITVPTLVLCGEQDTLCTPEMHREMARQVPNSTLHIVPRCGHLSTLEQPDAVNAAMRAWL
jgi:pimeloyl-ACP methyl ester carboxylesterase